MIFTCDDHYRPTNATWMRDSCTFSGCLMGKTRYKCDKVSHNMTQIASVLPVATIFTSLWTLTSRQRRGAYMRDKICMYAGIWAKSTGGLIREGGIIVGFYGTSYRVHSSKFIVSQLHTLAKIYNRADKWGRQTIQSTKSSALVNLHSCILAEDAIFVA